MQITARIHLHPFLFQLASASAFAMHVFVIYYNPVSWARRPSYCSKSVEIIFLRLVCKCQFNWGDDSGFWFLLLFLCVPSFGRFTQALAHQLILWSSPAYCLETFVECTLLNLRYEKESVHKQIINV